MDVNQNISKWRLAKSVIVMWLVFINSRVYWSFQRAGEIAWKDGVGVQILEVRSELLDAYSVDWKTSGET